MTKQEIEKIKERVIERVRAEFVAGEMSASGYADYHGCSTCGGVSGHAFTLDDVHRILNGLLEPTR